MAGVRILPKRRRLTLRQREEIEFYIAISPWLIGLLLFTGGPLIASLVMSFTNWTGLTTREWIGLQNYQKLFFGDRLFWVVLKNTFYYGFASVCLGTIGALLAAILMNQKVPGIEVFRTLYYLPSVTSGVAIAILWVWLFNPQVGLVNYLLSLVGIKGPQWLGSQRWAMPALILMSLWGIGGNMIILLAGLQGIPEYLYEAVRIDGGNKWHEFIHVTLPMLSPVLFYVIVISIIQSFQIFTNVYVMTRGGPGTATLVYVMYLYQNAFEYLKMGYASAMAWILFVIILGLTWLQFKASKYWVYYEFEER
ncbi:MAG TPA: sugar ABC transporter permease [Caldilineae bacterium]|nr:sugar ABC transporter permease [Caldilineae bacterium]